MEVGSEAVASLQPRPPRAAFPLMEDTVSGISINMYFAQLSVTQTAYRIISVQPQERA